MLLLLYKVDYAVTFGENATHCAAFLWGAFLVELCCAKALDSVWCFCAAFAVKAGCAAPIVKFTDTKDIFYIYIYLMSINGV